MRHAGLAVSVAGALCAAPLAAQTIQEETRCLIVSNVFLKAAKDEQARRAAAMSAGYYIGRLSQRPQTPALKAALATPPAGLTNANAGAVMNACVARVSQSETALRRK